MNNDGYTSSPFTVRNFRPCDLPQVINLHHSIFRSSDGPRIFYERCRSSELGSYWAVVESDQKKIIANYSIAKRYLNLKGEKRLLAGSSGLVMVDGASRFLRGVRPLSLQLADQMLTLASKEGVGILFGVPRENSKNAHSKRLGSIPVGKLREFFWPITKLYGKVSLVRWIRTKVQASNLKVSVSSCLPEDFDDLWARSKNHILVSTWKDKAYQEAQLASLQSLRHVYSLCLRDRNGVLVGYSLIMHLSRTAIIRELIVADGSIKIAKALVREVVRHETLSNKVHEIVFTGSPSSIGSNACNAIFFERDCSKTLLIKLLTEPSDPLSNLLLDINAWDFTPGDRD